MAAIAPATHAISTSQRNLTAREPIVLKMVSICTCRSLRGEPDKTLLRGCYGGTRPSAGPGRGRQRIWPSRRGARAGPRRVFAAVTELSGDEGSNEKMRHLIGLILGLALAA